MITAVPRFKFDPTLSLYLPFWDMRVGRSPNLLTNGDFETGELQAFYNVTRLTHEIDGVVKINGNYSLKTTVNDPTGDGNAFFILIVNNPTYYAGLTATGTFYARADSGNAYQAKPGVYDSPNVAFGTVVPVDGAWHQQTITRKIRSSSITRIGIYCQAKTASDANTTDVVNWDDVSLTVPQSRDRSHYGHLIYPEGPTPQGVNGWSFDGVDDLVSMGTPNPISEATWTGDLTIMGWMKGLTNLRRVLDNASLVLYQSVGAGENRLGLSSDALATGAFSAVNSVTDTTAWYHFAITRTAAGLATFWINGKLSGTANQNSGTPVAGTTNLCIGNRIAGDGGLAGTLDEFLVTRRILTPYEIQAHMLATRR